MHLFGETMNKIIVQLQALQKYQVIIPGGETPICRVALQGPAIGEQRIVEFFPFSDQAKQDILNGEVLVEGENFDGESIRGHLNKQAVFVNFTVGHYPVVVESSAYEQLSYEHDVALIVADIATYLEHGVIPTATNTQTLQ